MHRSLVRNFINIMNTQSSYIVYLIGTANLAICN